MRTLRAAQKDHKGRTAADDDDDLLLTHLSIFVYLLWLAAAFAPTNPPSVCQAHNTNYIPLATLSYLFTVYVLLHL